MLGEVEFLFLDDQLGEWRDPLGLAWADQRHLAAVDREIERRVGRAELCRIGGGIGQDHHRCLQALGTMNRHHPHRVDRCRRVALDLDITLREPGEEAIKRIDVVALEFKRR